jgi:hypothetical protein
VDKGILDLLEERIHLALRMVSEMQKRNALLLEENKDLKIRLSEHTQQVEQLRQQLAEQNMKSETVLLERYRETEEKLRVRIQNMLAKLDELKTLENR